MNRFRSGVSQICRGLYFKKYNQKWLEPIKVRSSCLLAQRENVLISPTEEFDIFNLYTEFFKNVSKQGENPEIFEFQMVSDVKKNEMLARLVFYGGFEVFCLSSPQLNKNSSS